MTSLETLADDIERMRDAGSAAIPFPLDLAELALNALLAWRANQGQPIPKIRARLTERPTHER